MPKFFGKNQKKIDKEKRQSGLLEINEKNELEEEKTQRYSVQEQELQDLPRGMPKNSEIIERNEQTEEKLNKSDKERGRLEFQVLAEKFSKRKEKLKASLKGTKKKPMNNYECEEDKQKGKFECPRSPPAPPKPPKAKHGEKTEADLKKNISKKIEKGKKPCKRRKDLFMDFSEDPNNLKPQPFKVGYLYKRGGNDYKTKRHFRLSKEGGLKLYKNEQDKVTASIDEICLDFMRCELQLGVSDVVNKDPRYFFCLKSDDLSGKSWFLAAESEYERKKWMISIAWHIQNECKPSVTDLNTQTKEYLGYPVSDDQKNDLDISSTNSDYESDSDGVYQAGIERSPRIAPQITEPDDEIYGEFDPNLAIQNEIMESTMAMGEMTLSVEPRRGSVDRKASTTLNIIPDLDTRIARTPIITEEEEDDTYMTAANVGSALPHPAQMSVSRGMLLSPAQLGEDEDDTYMDGFSLRASSSTSVEAPTLPVSRPPLFAPPQSPVHPSYEFDNTAAYNGHSASASSPFSQNQQLGDDFAGEDENLYMDQEELFSTTAEDDDIYAAPPLLGVDVQQPLNSAPPIPQRAPQNPPPGPVPPRNLPLAPRRPS